MIDQKNLYNQYQRKTQGTVAGFGIDIDGISKSGIEITDWLDDDTFATASVNTLATSESIKAYIDSNASLVNYTGLITSTTVLTSNIDGEAYAVVVPYDTKTPSSAGNTYTAYGASGVAGVSGSAYCFSLLALERGPAAFEFSWNVGANTSVINNRILGGVKLQQGVSDGENILWTDVLQTHSYMYNRGNGGVRYSSTSNGIIIPIEAAVPEQFFRILIWRESASHASVKLITEINATNLRITQIG
jgi:hypothetical protein